MPDTIIESQNLTESINAILKKSDQELFVMSDNDLIALASTLNNNVGVPNSREDSLKLIKALKLIDIVYKRNPKYLFGRELKIGILSSLGDYHNALISLRSFMSLKGSYPEGLMYMGMLFDISNATDSADLYYRKAFSSYKERINRKNNLSDQVSIAILLCILNDKNAGLAEIDKIILNNPSYRFAKVMKTQVIEPFNRKDFVKKTLEPKMEVHD